MVTTGSWGLDRMLKLMVFFLIGAHFPDIIRRMVRAIPAWPSQPSPCSASHSDAAAVLAVLTSGRLPPGRGSGIPRSGPTHRFGSRKPVARWLGKNTLPIYVLHMIALELGAVHPVVHVRRSANTVDLVPFVLTAFAIS